MIIIHSTFLLHIIHMFHWWFDHLSFLLFLHRHFFWRPLGPWLMRILLCITSCTWGYGFDYWVFEPSFLSFLSPYHLGLHYIPCLKTTLRPWDQMSSLTSPTWTGVWDTSQVDDLFLFYDDSLVEPFLSHLVRFILYDIVVIIWWSYLRRIALISSFQWSTCQISYTFPLSYSQVIMTDQMY